MITKPIPFKEAVQSLLDKEQVPSSWGSDMWSMQEPEFRAKAFFSSNVENARFIDRAQGLIFDFLTDVRDDVTTPGGEKTTVLRAGDRASFVALMRDFMVSEGMIPSRNLSDVNQKDVADLRSRARLNLIFDTNVRQAYGFGRWKQGMQPDALYAFPAMRLVRDLGVKEPRPRHQDNMGEVRLKTDPRWAEYHNATEIGGFGVPWGPYGFNSGAVTEDVSRAKALELGLNVPDEPERDDSGINDELRAGLKNMSAATKAKLLEELRVGIKPRDASEAGRLAGESNRRATLSRGMAEAVKNGDGERAARYSVAIANTPPPPVMIVHDRIDYVSLSTATRGMTAESIISLATDGAITAENAVALLVESGLTETEALALIGAA